MIDKKTEIHVMGQVLRGFREQQNISQEKLAEMASIHRTYAGGIERGERNPSFKSLNKILVSLNVSWTDFGKALDEQLLIRKNRKFIK